MLLKYVVVALLSFSVSLSGKTSYALQLFKPQILDTIRSTYGEAALARVERWRDLLEQGQSESDWIRLNKVNSLF